MSDTTIYWYEEGGEWVGGSPRYPHDVYTRSYQSASLTSNDDLINQILNDLPDHHGGSDNILAPLLLDNHATGNTPARAMSSDSSVTLIDTGNAYRYTHISDFSAARNFAVANSNDTPGGAFFTLITNQLGHTQNVDLSQALGTVIVGESVNVTAIQKDGQLIAQGSGTYFLGTGNERLSLIGPNGVVDGGDGIDEVLFSEQSAAVSSVMKIGDSIAVGNLWNGTNSGITLVKNLERLVFTDGVIALDTGAGQHAGAVYRLYEALDRPADSEGLGYWIDALDNGASLKSVAQAFINSAEFAHVYGSNLTNTQFVSGLYEQILHRVPDQSGESYWVAALNNGMSRAEVLTGLTESAENVVQSEPLTLTGVFYAPLPPLPPIPG